VEAGNPIVLTHNGIAWQYGLLRTSYCAGTLICCRRIIAFCRNYSARAELMCFIQQFRRLPKVPILVMNN
jgi:hypothetical protein